MRLDPHKVRTFNGLMAVFVVKRTSTTVSYLYNAVSYIHVRDVPVAEFDHEYEPTELTADRREKILAGFKAYAILVGMSSTATPVLPKAVAMTKEEVTMATEKGELTETRILGDAAAEHKKEGGAAAKAPRKLAGAALAAQQRKLAKAAEGEQPKTEAPKPGKDSTKKAVEKAVASRKATPDKQLAAEAKKLAGEVSKDQTAKEQAGTKDATLGKTPASATSGKPRAKVDKATTPPKSGTAAALKGKAGQFDVSKMKNAEGKYRSSSSMFKALIWEGKLDDDKIFAAVKKEFSLRDDQRSYVGWNRGWFKRNGIKLPG